MEDGLARLLAEFRAQEFCYDAEIYIDLLKKLLDLSVGERQTDVVAYLEMLEDILDRIASCFRPGTVTDKLRSRIFTVLQEEAREGISSVAWSSILSIFIYLLRYPGVTDWLEMLRSKTTNPELARAIDDCLSRPPGDDMI